MALLDTLKHTFYWPDAFKWIILLLLLAAHNCPIYESWYNLQNIAEYLQPTESLNLSDKEEVAGVVDVDDDDDYTGPFLRRCMTLITCIQPSVAINLWFCGSSEHQQRSLYTLVWFKREKVILVDTILIQGSTACWNIGDNAGDN